MGRLLLVGVPRSGTSWTGSTLGRTAGVRYVTEPDGFHTAFSFRVMMRHGENPQVAPGDAAPDYEQLWRGAFGGCLPTRDWRGRLAQRAFASAGTDRRRRARAGDGTSTLLRIARTLARPPRPDPDASDVLVKSVQCILSLEWIAARFAPRVLLVFRSPLNTLASWQELGFVRNPRETAALSAYARAHWGVTAPASGASRIAHQAFTFGVLSTALASAAEAHPEWIVAHHEDLCLDAPSRFRSLADRLGLTWTDAAERFLHDSNRGGRGFATDRITRAQPERWRERLSDDDVREIRAVLDGFPEAARTDR
jgi:hypothetical protein